MHKKPGKNNSEDLTCTFAIWVFSTFKY